MQDLWFAAQLGSHKQRDLGYLGYLAQNGESLKRRLAATGYTEKHA
jgi:hypothetical protein